MTTRRFFTAASLMAAPLAILREGSALAQISEMPPTPKSEAEQIALDAYVFGYSLITTEVTRVQMSNVEKIEGLHAPMGQFINIKRYPPADFRGVSAPNADTLYSLAWLDRYRGLYRRRDERPPCRDHVQPGEYGPGGQWLLDEAGRLCGSPVELLVGTSTAPPASKPSRSVPMSWSAAASELGPS